MDCTDRGGRHMDARHYWSQTCDEDEDEDEVEDETRSITKVDWTNDMDLDPFGSNWVHELPQFLMAYQVKTVLSAQRITHPKMFGYHMYFTAGPPGGSLSYNYFAEVLISRKYLPFFKPEIVCCEVIQPEKYYYEKGCRFCVGWVPHPKGIKTIKFPQFPNYNPLFDMNNDSGFPIAKRPWYSYISQDESLRLSKEIRPRRFGPESIDPKRFTGGLNIDDDCKLKFQALKTSRTPTYIIFKLDMSTFVVSVEKVVCSLEVLSTFLPTDECRYAVIDFDSKIIFVEWSPHTADFISRMKCGDAKEEFKRELGDFQVVIKVTCHSEMTKDVLLGMCRQAEEEATEDVCRSVQDVHLE